MDKYICQCCGGKIDPKTMTCDYCGTQYKKENDIIYRVEHCDLPVVEFADRINIPKGLIKDENPTELTEIFVNKIAQDLARQIAPFCEFRYEEDFMTCAHVIDGRIRIVKPAYNTLEDLK